MGRGNQDKRIFQRALQANGNKGWASAKELTNIKRARQTSDQPPPRWWAQVESYGPRTRCNILFRQALSAKRQRMMCEDRAQAVHGLSLRELCRKTGKDEAFFTKFLSQLSAADIKSLGGRKLPV